ncbi:hypothetical protein WJX84_003184 [Apatococcus fuscideae]|uniref:Uncharacterized protein n=1 Tax=Apatococcus fuscideae TaxID=2026836 RepID=A0AAW1TIA9_9CHLO
MFHPSRLAIFWNAPITDLTYGAAGNRLLALHDATLADSWTPPRGSIAAWDTHTWRAVDTVQEFSESYHLVCFATGSSDGSLAETGHELVAGAVHQGICNRCYNSGVPSLCCHKSLAHSALLCIFDTRASLSEVQRYSLPHRSLMPRLTCARDHYVFTSHVGAPLCTWDRRYMSMPLHQEDRLWNIAGAELDAPLLFGPPSRPVDHQALFLDTDGDVLLGRAENGMMWAWDLTVTLGIAGSRGSWMSRALDNTVHWSWADYPDWPIPLGAWDTNDYLATAYLAHGHFQMGDIIHLRLQESEELPGFRQQIVFADERQNVLSHMQPAANELPALSLPLFGMSRTSNGDWNSWMDSQFNAINAMNQAVMGRRGGCGGHMRHQESFQPVLVRGVPTMTTPSAVMQRLASARFGSDILRALIEDQMEMDRQWSSQDAPDMNMLGDALIADDSDIDMPASEDAQAETADLGITILPAINGLETGNDAEDVLSWEQSERLLNQADEDEEADAEADATEAESAEWASFMPTWITSPEDLETSDDAAPTSAINWSFQNDDGSLNWGLIVFIVQATACITVWAGLMATLGYYRFRRSSGSPRGRQQFATSAGSHLVTPLMYESIAKGDHSPQLYEDLYQVEDAKLHADDREYVAIQYVPLKSEI